MELKFRCVHCNRKLEADATLAGTTLCCPNCDADVTIPESRVGPDTTLGGFRIEKLLGKGAMGEVFLATQLAMDRKIALKVLPGKLVYDSDFVERFFQEVRMAAKLQHPNIVSAYGAGKDHGYYYFAMAYVEGTTLAMRLEREGKIPEREAMAIGVQLAEALAYAWDNCSTLHRDIKPGNIMITDSGQPMIMDMGIAKSVGEDSHLTATGVAVGTPHYMSPEQAKGSHALDFRTDMYSLGATLFHLVAGGVPFTGNSAMEVVARHLHDPLPSLRKHCPDASQTCEELIERMMAKDRSHRYPSWGACLKDMGAVLKGRMPETSKAKVAQRASEHLVQQRQSASLRRSGGTAARVALAPWIVAGVCLLAALIVGVLTVVSRNRASEAARAQRPAARRVWRPSPSTTRPANPEPAQGSAESPDKGVDRRSPAAPAGEAERSADPPAGAQARLEANGADPEATTGDGAGTDHAGGGEDIGNKATPPGGQTAGASPVAESAAPPAPATPPDPLSAAIKPLAAELVAGRPAMAASLWKDARGELEGVGPAEKLDGLSETLAYLASTERLILESFRATTDTPIVIHLRNRSCRVMVKSVDPPTVRVLEVLDKGSIGSTIACRDLNMTEKLRRIGAPDAPNVALARGMIALCEDRTDLALEELHRFDSPLASAMLRRLDELEAQKRDQAADRTFLDMASQLLRSSLPRDRDGLLAAFRDRLQSSRRRDKLIGWLETYRATYGDADVGRQRIAFLESAVLYPHEGCTWTVPDLGLEFVWIDGLSAWVGKYEVTNGQYRKFFKEHDAGSHGDLPLNGDDCPAVSISFDEAHGFAAFVTELERGEERLPEGFRYRLPWRNEWTHVASCGDGRLFPWGPTWPPPPAMNYNGTEWLGTDSARLKDHTDPYPGTCPVAQSGANPLGLYGIGGNASEWTAGANGASPELRGNSWCGSGSPLQSPSGYTVAATLRRGNSSFSAADTGFRLVLARDPKEAVEPAAPR